MTILKFRNEKVSFGESENNIYQKFQNMKTKINTRFNILFIALMITIALSKSVNAQFVTIGKQKWMSKNLDVTTFRNGDTITHAQTEKEWDEAGKSGIPAWCYYDNNPEKGAAFGKLYNWFAVTDPRRLAPDSCHIPKFRDWLRLIDFVGGTEIAGLKLKNSKDWSKIDLGTNNFGFSALPGGLRIKSHFIDELACFWSSSEDPDSKENGIDISMGEGTGIIWGVSLKGDGYSVRCLRD